MFDSECKVGRKLSLADLFGIRPRRKSGAIKNRAAISPVMASQLDAGGIALAEATVAALNSTPLDHPTHFARSVNQQTQEAHSPPINRMLAAKIDDWSTSIRYETGLSKDQRLGDSPTLESGIFRLLRSIKSGIIHSTREGQRSNFTIPICVHSRRESCWSYLASLAKQFGLAITSV